MITCFISTMHVLHLYLNWLFVVHQEFLSVLQETWEGNKTGLCFTNPLKWRKTP